MSSKTNTFPIEKLKKAPIRFGGFGNLFKHTHTHTQLICSLAFARKIRLSLQLSKEGLFRYGAGASNLEIINS